MENPEKTFNQEKKDPEKMINDIIYKAAEMLEFKEAVTKASSKIEALKAVRLLLRKHFPQISEISEEHRPDVSIASGAVLIPPRGFKKVFSGRISPEFKIARGIIDLLREQK